MKTNKIAFLIFLILILSLSVTAVTISGGSSSYSFTVANCTANPSTDLNCSASTIRYECDFGNIGFIDSVQYRVQGINYLTTQNATNPTKFYLFYNKPVDTTSNNDPILFDRQTVTDTDGHSVNANLLVSLNHSCTLCNVVFNTTPITSCGISNTQIIEHISSNDTCSPSFNTTSSCNYCSPEIFANYTSCNTNGTRSVSYYDTNYTTCCLATGLSEDCIINTATYNNANETCNYYNQQLTCTLDSQPVLNDKINVNCELPNQEETCCVLNIYQGTNFDSLLQTSPEYKDSKNLIFSGQTETRTCFTPNNRLLNAYYTKKELRGDYDYKLEVKCTNSNTTLISSYNIKPTYHIPDEPVQKLLFAEQNPQYVVFAIIVFIILISIVIYYIRQARKR